MAKGTYRDYSKDFLGEIVEDFKEACKNKNISKQALYDMAWRVSWELTEWRGADIGYPFWSKKAFDLLELEKISSNSKETIYKCSRKLKEKIKGKIIHEHIVPRNLLTEYIIKCRENDVEPRRENFEKIIQCIITREEDSLLKPFNSTFPDLIALENIKNPWDRYIDCGINEIYYVKWGKEKIIVSDYNIVKNCIKE